MKGPTDRRHKSLGALLFSDPYRKLVALALALALWFYLDNQVSDVFKLTLELQAYSQVNVFNEPGERKLAVPIPNGSFTVTDYSDGTDGSKAENVTLTFRGPKALIKELKSSHNFRFRAREAAATATSVEFGLEDLVGRQQFLDLIDEMSPARVRVGLEKLTEIQLEPDIEQILLRFASPAVSAALSDRLRKERATLSPPTIVIQGPESKINRAKGLTFATLPIKMDKDAVKTSLVLVAKDPELSMKQSVMLTIPIEPKRNSYAMEIPVIVSDGMMPDDQRDKWVPDEKSKTCTVEVYGAIELRYLSTPSERGAFPTKHFVLVVHLEESDKDAEVVTRVAELVAFGLEEIPTNEYRLADTVAITVRRAPQ